MKRELKRFAELTFGADFPAWNSGPDEEGIETFVLNFNPVRDFLSWNSGPDEEGIETFSNSLL